MAVGRSWHRLARDRQHAVNKCLALGRRRDLPSLRHLRAVRALTCAHRMIPNLSRVDALLSHNHG
jgi:hypothetical protein